MNVPHPVSIALTGASGFFGWHLRSHLRAKFPEISVRIVGHAELASVAILCDALTGVDAVVHLAGANRGADDEVYWTNRELANRVIGALTALGESPALVYANTVQADSDSSYGRSKREAGNALTQWGRRADAAVADIRFPNLYGEGGRPGYNSAVATFSHDLAEGRTSVVNADGHVELLHIQDACALIMQLLEDKWRGSKRVEGKRVAVPEVYSRLHRLHRSYRCADVPELRDRLDRRLFSALRTAMFPAHYPMRLIDHRDPRGLFGEAARASGHTQISFSTTVPGCTRGEHFHLEKMERFVVVSGQAVVEIRRLFSDDVHSFAVSGEAPVALDMPAMHAHNITNVGTSELVTLFWTNDHFDANAPDTYPEPVWAQPCEANA